MQPSYLQTLGPAVLNSNINSALAQASGIPKPYPTFNGSVAQALRPYPQFSGIDTWSGAGDHSGHSSYHAGIIKIEKRYSSGLTFQTSYVFSKLFTDSDTYWVTDNPRAADQYNRRLEKSIGYYDITHNFKLGLVYDLPFGKGRKYLTSGIAERAPGRMARQLDSILCQRAADRHQLGHRSPDITERGNPAGCDDHDIR